jgi:hypothetical protein
MDPAGHTEESERRGYLSRYLLTRSPRPHYAVVYPRGFRAFWSFVCAWCTYGRSCARPMPARQASLKSPYSVGTPSRENLWQVWPPPPAPQVVHIQTQSGGLDTWNWLGPATGCNVGWLQQFLWDTGGTIRLHTAPSTCLQPAPNLRYTEH